MVLMEPIVAVSSPAPTLDWAEHDGVVTGGGALGSPPARGFRRHPLRVARDAAPSEKEKEFGHFLRSLEAPPIALPVNGAATIRRVWLQLRAGLGPTLPVPGADRPEEEPEVLLRFFWYHDRAFVEVEFLDGGGLRWFSRDNRSGAADGGDTPVPVLPRRLLDALGLLAGG